MKSDVRTLVSSSSGRSQGLGTASQADGRYEAQAEDQALKSVKFLPLHAILFGHYPVLALLSANIKEMPVSDAYRSIAIVFISACLMIAVLGLVLRDLRRAGVLSSLFLILFFSYGHLYGLLINSEITRITGGVHRFLAPAWIAIAIVGSGLTISRKHSIWRTTRLLNAVSIAAIILPLSTILWHVADLGRPSVQNEGIMEEPQLRPSQGTTLPDIYYIILDAYARPDILHDHFNYDNSALTDYLATRGFYLAEESNSNYLRTTLSLASSLNMNYLDDLGLDLSKADEPFYLHEPISHSVVRDRLESLGYSTVSMPSGYRPTEVIDVSHYLTPAITRFEELRAHGAFNDFEGLLFETSAGRILVDLDALRNTPMQDFIAQRLRNRKEITREIVLSAFDHLANAGSIPGPKLVFTHLVTPHDPYLFGPNGEYLEGEVASTLTKIPIAAEAELYLDQLTYINTELMESVDAILSSSESPPVIVIQSDHGPGFGQVWQRPDAQALAVRSSILNAYYIRDECADHLYASISPVNTFRVIFNCYFGASYDLLEYETFFLTQDDTQPFVTIGDLLN